MLNGEGLDPDRHTILQIFILASNLIQSNLTQKKCELFHNFFFDFQAWIETGIPLRTRYLTQKGENGPPKRLESPLLSVNM